MRIWMQRTVAAILVMVLLLTGTVALAATLLWQDYVPQMKQTEHEFGDYDEWPAARRIQLAKDIDRKRDELEWIISDVIEKIKGN